MFAYYKLHHSINNGIYGYARLHFSFFYVWLLSFLYPGKKSVKHGQSFTEHAINSWISAITVTYVSCMNLHTYSETS